MAEVQPGHAVWESISWIFMSVYCIYVPSTVFVCHFSSCGPGVMSVQCFWYVGQRGGGQGSFSHVLWLVLSARSVHHVAVKVGTMVGR